MPSDRDLVSSEDHEINYLLRKWNKKQSKKNREILVAKLKDFKSDDDYKPHNRENFYKYVDENDVKSILEDIDSDSEKTLVKDSGSGVQKTIVDTDKTIISDTGSSAEQKKSILPIIFIIIAVIILILLILFGFYVCRKNPNLFGKDQKTEETKTEDTKKEEDKKEDPIALIKTVINENTPIYFIANKTDLVAGEESKIENIISELKKHDKVMILIEGHTAKVGNPEGEMRLSIRRAEKVKKMIADKVDADIEFKGFGSEKEAVSNPSKDEMKKNRRVVIVLKE